MNEHATMHDHATRLERVFKWLADHLDHTIDLTRLADVACLSPYHFHRVYRAMRGETVTETVRRLRLHRAAVELITGERPVSRIARRAGYSSQALPHRGDYHQIATTFEQLAAIAGGMNLFGPPTRSFGIYYDNPTATPQDKLRSDACLTVPEGWSPSGRLESREIRGGRYAVFLHVGPYAELEKTYKWVYGTWLAQSGEELADAPLVEEYLNDVRSVPPPELRTEIWLPLR